MKFEPQYCTLVYCCYIYYGANATEQLLLFQSAVMFLFIPLNSRSVVPFCVAGSKQLCRRNLNIMSGVLRAQRAQYSLKPGSPEHSPYTAYTRQGFTRPPELCEKGARRALRHQAHALVPPHRPSRARWPG